MTFNVETIGGHESVRLSCLDESVRRKHDNSAGQLIEAAFTISKLDPGLTIARLAQAKLDPGLMIATVAKAKLGSVFAPTKGSRREN